MEIWGQRGQQHDPPANINSSNDSIPDSIEIWDSDFEFAAPVSILNGPLQATLLALLVLFSISANACVINNIRYNCIKLRSTHFILIQHLCLADLIGASLILPAPLVTSLTGKWEGGERLCHLSSVVNVALWLQHVFMFAMLKVPPLTIPSRSITSFSSLGFSIKSRLNLLCQFIFVPQLTLQMHSNKPQILDS